MYRRDDSLGMLAQKCIDTYEDLAHLRESECRIVYLMSDAKKTSGGKVTFADTEKVSDKSKAVCGYDFIITFYENPCKSIDDEQMEILMHHELKHVGFDEETGKRSIIPHDVEDFRSIIEAHGIDWCSD